MRTRFNLVGYARMNATFRFNTRLSRLSRSFITIMEPLDMKGEAFSFEAADLIYRKQVPRLFQNVVSHWAAVSDDEKKWSNLENLLHRIGKGVVAPIECDGSYMDKSMKILNIDMQDYLIYLIKMKNHLANENSASKKDNGWKMYLAQTELSDISTVLLEDISPRPIITTTGKGSIYRVNLWLGYNTTSPCHHDPFQNILCQVFGKKHVILFAPNQSEYLYPAYGTLQRNTSLVEIRNPDRSLHPLFDKVTGFSCTLEEGDAVFIPKVCSTIYTNIFFIKINFFPFHFITNIMHFCMKGLVALLLD